MVRLSDLVAAAEEAPQSRLEQALALLRGETSDANREVTSEEAAKILRVNEKTVRRKCVPLMRLGGRNYYRLGDVKEALTA
jgi:hypothetical protein